MSALVPPLSADRIAAAFRAFLRNEDTLRKYQGIWEYVVQHTDGVTVDALPTDPSQNLPGLTKIPMRSGVAGVACKPSTGTKVYIAFANADPTLPVIIAYDTPGAQSATMNTGTGTVEHLTTTEAVVNLINNIFIALFAANAGTWVGAAVAATLTAAINTAIAAAGAPATGSVSPFSAAIASALGVKQLAGGDLGGSLPNVGCPNLLGG